MEVLGIGSAFVDTILRVDERFLDGVPGAKGGMEPIDYETLVEILDRCPKGGVEIAGGSCTNVIRGLAHLGQECGVIGRVGDDLPGQMVAEQLQTIGVTPYYHKSDIPTGSVLSLVTPDGKRTCRTYLGASSTMTPDLLDPALFEGVKLVHIEGYSLLYPGLTERAMELAKGAGAKISFDMASFEVVQQFHDQILELLNGPIDIAFVNEDEALALTEFNPEATCDVLRGMCEIAVVLIGKDGCWVGSGTESRYCSAFPVSPLDTTGAGDCFAAGFLHGVLSGLPLEECARLGALAGRAVVQVLGAELSAKTWQGL